MGRLILIGIASIFLFSCSSENAKRGAQKLDIDSVLTAQQKELFRVKSRLERIATVNGQQSQAASVPDSVEWATQLDVFRALDIVNRPSFRDAYAETIGTDTESNLRVRTLSATSTSPVPFLKVYYLGDEKKIRRIQGSYREDNALFTSSKLLTLNFEDVQGRSLLTGYRIEGFQKMLMTDTVHFDLEATVTF